MAINLLYSTKLLKGNSGYHVNSSIKYPHSLSYEVLSNFQVLLLSIKSLSSLCFVNVYFFIDLFDAPIEQKQILEETIRNSIKSKNLIVNWNRPYSKSSWISELSKMDNNYAYIVNMNHDMINYCKSDELDYIIRSAYGNNKPEPKSQNTVIPFCHIQEILNWGINGFNGFKFIGNAEEYYFLKSKRKWLDCIYIMQLTKLIEIFKSIINDPVYLPRFDWKGVEMQEFHIDFVVYPCKLFEHYDESTHVIQSSIIDYFRDNGFIYNSDAKKYFLEFIELHYITLSFFHKKFMHKSKEKFTKKLIDLSRKFIDFKYKSHLNVTPEVVDEFYGFIKYYENFIFIKSKNDSESIKINFKILLSHIKSSYF